MPGSTLAAPVRAGWHLASTALAHQSNGAKGAFGGPPIDVSNLGATGHRDVPQVACATSSNQARHDDVAVIPLSPVRSMYVSG